MRLDRAGSRVKEAQELGLPIDVLPLMRSSVRRGGVGLTELLECLPLEQKRAFALLVNDVLRSAKPSCGLLLTFCQEHGLDLVDRGFLLGCLWRKQSSFIDRDLALYATHFKIRLPSLPPPTNGRISRPLPPPPPTGGHS